MAIVFKNPDLESPLSMEVAGPSLVFLGACIPLYWLIIAAYESCRGRSRARAQLEENDDLLDVDEDVIEEEKRVTSDQSLKVVVDRVKKYYGEARSVQRASFGLEYGECFALLGVSGAGKTTTFKCLTGEEIPTAGEVKINGFDVTTRTGFN